MKIKLQLRDFCNNDSLMDASGFDYYALNEGADPDTWHEFEVDEKLLYKIKLIDRSK